MLSILKHDKISIAAFSAMFILLVLGWGFNLLFGLMATVFVLVTGTILFINRTLDQYTKIKKLFSMMVNTHSIKREFLSLTAPDIREFFSVIRIDGKCEINSYNCSPTQISLRVYISNYHSYETVTFHGNGVFYVGANEYKSINRFLEWLKEDENVRSGKAFMR
ncbi:hypothetical protein phiOC_p191 [Ochrobactrum phage vB_OspM_OC]|nr:hypothetical protein phiOC_p191 [Ochrobactrum phage vB_OspM_OC]